MGHSITFITCLIKIYDDNEIPFHHKDTEWRLQHFRDLANTGIRLCVYGCEHFFPILKLLESEYSENVKIMQLNWKDTETYKICMETFQSHGESILPERRNHKKDTIEYMTLMNSKIEFVNDAIRHNVWNSNTFAWVDFSMSYLFHNKPASLETIKHLKFSKNTVCFPGCWDRIPPENADAITNNIHWRFCGTFFIGNKDLLIHFYQKYLEEFPKFIQRFNKIVWEVNFWAWLESNTDCSIEWYSSDHNDRLLNVPE
jgi:hypothetical protein